MFVFDANVLLHTYLYTESAREQFLQVLEQIKDRIWIPYQAAYEFQKNRLDVIEQIYSVETEFKKEIKAIIKQVEKMKGKKHYKLHPFIGIDSLLESVKSELQRIESTLRERSENHPNLRSRDSLFDRITRLFHGKVGSPLPKEQLPQIYEEAEFRIQNGIPPGYRDQDKTNNRYGDILIWYEILEYAKQVKKPIIFVTNDEKEDWWRDQYASKPRAELINEMIEKADVPFYMYTSDRFLTMSKKLLNTQAVTEETIQEAEGIRKEYRSKLISLHVIRNLAKQKDQIEFVDKLSRYAIGAEIPHVHAKRIDWSKSPFAIDWSNVDPESANEPDNDEPDPEENGDDKTES